MIEIELDFKTAPRQTGINVSMIESLELAIERFTHPSTE
jgi:hypothetical protein